MQSYSFEKTDTGYQQYIEDMPVCDGYVENVRRAMRECTDKHIEVGSALITLYESRVYGVHLGGKFYQLHSSNFFSFCELRFGLGRSQVSRYIDVVYNFCRGDKLLPQYENKSFSYLCELLPLTESEVEDAIIHCNTVAELRNYKKELKGQNSKKVVATSQIIEPSVQNNATSQIIESTTQSDPVEKLEIIFELRPLHIPPKESYSGKYEDFRGMTLMALCDKCINLENELRRVTAEMKRYKMQYENEVAALSSCVSCSTLPSLDFLSNVNDEDLPTDIAG